MKAKNIVEKINTKFNRWKLNHEAFDGAQVIRLCNSYITLYSVGLITENEYKRDSEFVYSCLQEIIYDYRYSTDTEYKEYIEITVNILNINVSREITNRKGE